MNGRCSAFSHPLNPDYLNGLTYLPVTLETHAPIGTLIVFLGTNDLFLPYRLSAYFVAEGVGALVDLALASQSGHTGGAPQVLVLVPPPLGPPILSEPHIQHGIEESRRLSEGFRRMAEQRRCELLDLRGVVEPDPTDGIHFTAEAHRTIGLAVAKALRGLDPGNRV